MRLLATNAKVEPTTRRTTKTVGDNNPRGGRPLPSISVKESAQIALDAVVLFDDLDDYDTPSIGAWNTTS